MALAEADHRLFVATRTPPRLVVFDTNSGHLVATLPTVQDSDDLYYDSARQRVYVPGGEGYISVFQQDDADHYKLLAKVQTAIGAQTQEWQTTFRADFHNGSYTDDDIVDVFAQRLTTPFNIYKSVNIPVGVSQLNEAPVHIRLAAGSPMDGAAIRAFRELLRRKAERIAGACRLSSERATILQPRATVESFSLTDC
jgi:hypothetical protein